MLSTNLSFAEKDLIETVRIFPNCENLNIAVTASGDEKGTVITVRIDEKTDIYNYNAVDNSGVLEYKRLMKRYAKLSLYKSLESKFGKKMPWGSITGIRPVKLAYQLISEGIDYKSYMTDFLLVDKKSVEMVESIIDTQKTVLKFSDDNFDLFVGIPFCPSRCLYCSFISMETAAAKNYIGGYADALAREITEAKALIKKLSSVYIGGGTPVSIGIKPLEKILKAVGEVNGEYSVEAGRPDAVNKDILKLLKDYNVNRICINPQTFSDRTLKLIGRNHTAADTLSAYELARDYGFDINMDAIAGLSGESVDDLKKTIDKLIELAPENITVHTLALKSGSRLKEQTKQLDEGDIGKMIEYSRIKLMENGYNPYYMYRQKFAAGGFENVGYSKRGKECIYNINIMEEVSQNIACGADAISKRVFDGGSRIERYKNPKDIKTYLEKLDILIEGKRRLYK